MNTSQRSGKTSGVLLCLAALALAGCAGVLGTPQTEFALSGAEEVPPVATSASGTGMITVGTDRSISGRVTTAGVQGVAAHIHFGARGLNGPVTIGLVKAADNIWAVPPNTVLNDDQYRAFLKGDLYVNVHSPNYKGGEIRGQLRPLANNW